MSQYCLKTSNESTAILQNKRTLSQKWFTFAVGCSSGYRPDWNLYLSNTHLCLETVGRHQSRNRRPVCPSTSKFRTGISLFPCIPCYCFTCQNIFGAGRDFVRTHSKTIIPLQCLHRYRLYYHMYLNEEQCQASVYVYI